MSGFILSHSFIMLNYTNINKPLRANSEREKAFRIKLLAFKS